MHKLHYTFGLDLEMTAMNTILHTLLSTVLITCDSFDNGTKMSAISMELTYNHGYSHSGFIFIGINDI